MAAPLLAAILALVTGAVAGCGDGAAGSGAAGTTAGLPTAGESATASASGPAPAPPRAHVPPPVREGGALARAAEGDGLFLADEDHGVVRRFALPDPAGSKAIAREMPGRPAQVLPLDGRVLVTIRDPGLLVVLRSSGDQALSEEARIAVPPDAWGIAITPDEKVALVTSAWTHAVTAVDLDARKVLWSIDVAREPRGVVITPDGARAYVTHLVGEAVTRIDDLRGAPRAGRVPLLREGKKGPAPRVEPAPRGGSLAYSALLSPDGSRLFVPRHGVGGFGPTRWFGEPEVTVLWTKDDSLLLPPAASYYQSGKWVMENGSPFGISGEGLPSFEVARAAVFRRSTNSFLMASEATDAVLELDAWSLRPSEQPLRVFRTGRHYEEQAQAARQGGAPTGVALSEDEQTAYVFCRSTYDLVSFSLRADTEPPSPPVAEPQKRADPMTFLRIAEDPLGEDASVGRRLFYTAMDPEVTDAVSCATCHPEGRDDAFVWTEVEGTQFLSLPFIQGFAVRGAPRQTPMIAGRVAAEGPYGWLAESPNLKSRIIAGFGLHRWNAETIPRSSERQRDSTAPGDPKRKHRGEHLALFIRKGLVPPPASFRAPADVVARGKAVFEDEKVGCAGCHVPKTDYTNRAAVALAAGLHRPAGFEDPPSTAYKTPSLLHVVGTAPYYHDGSAETLDQLVFENGNRMGKTAHLSDADKSALVAFLKTIGTGPLADDGSPLPVPAAPLVPVAAASGVPSGAATPPPGGGAATASVAASAAPDEPATPRPGYADWKDSEPFALTRTVKSCSARKLREYVRVKCDGSFVSAYTANGPTKDQQFWEGKVVETGMFAVFPLRRGERRLLLMTDAVGLGKYGALSVPGRVISVTWLPGEEPIVDVD